MKPRLHLHILGCIFGCLLLLSLPSAGLPLSCVIDGRYTMGTVLQLTLCGTDPDQTRHTSDSLFQTAARLDRLLTTYAPDSPVSRLNAAAGQGAMPVPVEVMDALSLSVRYWELTGGTFDITVGPLLALWKTAPQLPSPDAVRHTLSRVGSHRIVLSPHGTAALAQNMALDLGGIGKGFALDRMVALLKERRVSRALLNFGHSSQWAVGRPPDAPGWRLLVRLPDGTLTGHRHRARPGPVRLGQPGPECHARRPALRTRDRSPHRAAHSTRSAGLRGRSQRRPGRSPEQSLAHPR